MFLKGIGALVLTLVMFSLFSMKAPSGDKAMNGLANAAIATFLVEAIGKYILGDFAGIPFFAAIGESAGSLGGPAAAILVGLSMGTDPVLAVVSGVALSHFGILPGFVAGYVLHFVLKPVQRFLPAGLDVILGALFAATAAYGISWAVEPAVNLVIGTVGEALLAATRQMPLLMGLLLGGVIKMVCTSPLSSMALTAMLSLTGLPMGIACIACFGGAFSNGVVFWQLGLGEKGSAAAVIVEPLTQADTISRNPIPVYASSFFGGAMSGIAAAALHIVCDAPGTASTVPGMLAPFAFNDPLRVLLALGIAVLCGVAGGFLSVGCFRGLAHCGVRLYKSAAQETERLVA
jgi:fructose-specific phosphotransferase system IIC component